MEQIITFIFGKNIPFSELFFGKALPVGVVAYTIKIFWDIRKTIWEVRSDYKSQTKECNGKFNAVGIHINNIKEDVKNHDTKILLLEDFKNEIKVKLKEKYGK